MAEPKRWLITGVSSGLGRAIAEHALSRGDLVAGTLRRPDQFAAFEALAPGRAFAIGLDVTDDAAVGPAVDEAVRRLGGLDVLVNNAGYALMGPVEEVDLAEARREIETNLVGLLKVCQAAAPRLRAQGSGRIVNIGSVASTIGFPMNGLYSATKFAVAGLSESLDQELRPFGVRATVVEPGGFRTEFGAGSLTVSGGRDPAYAAAVETLKGRMAAFAQRAANDPARGAAVIAALVDHDDPPVRLTLGADGYAMVTGALRKRLAEYEAWQGFGGDTAYPPE